MPTNLLRAPRVLDPALITLDRREQIRTIYPLIDKDKKFCHWVDAYTWKAAHMGEFLREKRLRWFGHVQRRDKDEAMINILQMTVNGKRNRGRPKPR